MSGSGASTEIGIVLYPGAQLAAVHGLTDLLGIASHFAREGGSAVAAPLRITHWSPTNGGIFCVYRSEPSARPAPGILILPPTLADLPEPALCTAIGDWLLGEHGRGTLLVTVCSGVFLVAGTGLLDGRVVSTHHSCAKALQEGFPKVGVDTEARIIEHPGILTAGGFMAWVDVALVLIERLLGEAVRAETARFALAGAGAAAGAPDFNPRLAHADPAVRRAQELVHLHDGHGLSLAAMAAAAGLERRTFLRRFIGATGATPIEYCRAVRMARARELLEAGSMPLKSIAEALGYMDTGSFAKAFRQVCGVPPGAYRRRAGGPASGQVRYPPDREAAGAPPAAG